jgi:hypothetical protein
VLGCVSANVNTPLSSGSAAMTFSVTFALVGVVQMDELGLVHMYEVVSLDDELFGTWLSCRRSVAPAAYLVSP